MYFCCLTEVRSLKKCPSVGQTRRRRRLWHLVQAESSPLKLLKHQECCRIWYSFCFGLLWKEESKKKCRNNKVCTFKRQATRDRSVPEKTPQTTQMIPHNALSKSLRPSFFALGCHWGGNGGEELFWTLINVLRTFLVNVQTEMPQTKKKSKWAAFWRLSNSRWSLADKEILTVVIGQFPELSFYQNLELDWLFFNPINGRIVFFCLKILIRCEICVSFL